jgi:hypothetical protein
MILYLSGIAFSHLRTVHIRDHFPLAARAWNGLIPNWTGLVPNRMSPVLWVNPIRAERLSEHKSATA